MRNFQKLKFYRRQEIAKALKIFNSIKMDAHLFLCKTKAKLMHWNKKI